ncbi:MAG: serine hydrolase domain-containing protein [Acidobacteriota bacterium]
MRLFAAALAVFTAHALAVDNPARLRASKIQEIEHVVSAVMAKSGIPGLSVAIGQDLRVTWTQGFGRADVENRVPVEPETVFRIASISKSITAVAVMQLVEKGKLSLEAPIQKYVPSFPEKEWPVTARALLSHMSGIRHYNSIAEVNSTRHYTDVIEPLRIFAGEPLEFEPGTRYLYTTYGFNLLGAAVEGASGEPYLNYVREHIFAPAHMERTGPDDAVALIANRARGYRHNSAGAIENCALVDTSNKIPGGGYVSTAEDLVRFAIAVLRGDLVSAKTRERMFTAARLADGKAVPYGLGWAVVERGGKKWVGHGGAQPGASTYLLTDPSGSVTVAVLANVEGANAEAIAARIAEIALEN